jgi:hypothetical protein
MRKSDNSDIGSASRRETIPNTNSDRWNKSDISDKKHPILSVNYQFPKKNAKVVLMPKRQRKNSDLERI